MVSYFLLLSADPKIQQIDKITYFLLFLSVFTFKKQANSKCFNLDVLMHFFTLTHHKFKSNLILERRQEKDIRDKKR